MTYDRTFSFRPVKLPQQAGAQPQYLVVDRPLDRILAFTGYSIDDIVDNPIARQTVFGFFKVHKQIQRRAEVLELERQWNAIA